MAQYSVSRKNKKKPQKNDDLYEVVMIAEKDGEIIEFDNPLHIEGTTINPWGNPVLQVDDDTVQHTSRNRRKVSTQEIVYFNSYTNDKDPDVWDEELSFNATSEFDEYNGGILMTLTDSEGSEVIRQTKYVMRYIPGRQNELVGSMVFHEPQAGIRRRLGLFDSDNGFFFEDDGGTYSCVIRHTTSEGRLEDRVTRDNWNVDKLDGQGPSGILADPNKIQMFTFEYEWFGAGQVEFNWIVANNKIPIHQFDAANILNRPWCATPNLPYRVEFTNTNGAIADSTGHRLFQSGFCLMSENSVGPIGRRKGVASPITGKTLTAANTFYPVLSVRLKESQINAVVNLSEFQAATLDNTNIFYRITKDPTLTGASWTSVGENSVIEYDVSATAATDGVVISSGFIVGENQGANIALNGSGESYTQIGRNDMGTTSEIYTIEIASVGSNKAAFASIDWIEVR